MNITSRVRTLSSASVMLIAPLFLSCSDSTAPHPGSRYQLSTVDGQPLPYDLVSILSPDGTPATGGKETLLADTIQILNSTDFRRGGSVSTLNLFSHLPEVSPYALAGSYNLSGGTLTLTWIAYPPGSGPTPVSESFVVKGATLRIKRVVGPRCTDGTPQCADRPLVDFVYVAR